MDSYNIVETGENAVTIEGFFLNDIKLVPHIGDIWWKSLVNTLWEKEKMLVTNIFSFSHDVFFLSFEREIEPF